MSNVVRPIQSEEKDPKPESVKMNKSGVSKARICPTSEPEEWVSRIRAPRSESLVSESLSWRFDVNQLVSLDNQIFFVLHLAKQFDLHHSLNIPLRTIHTFIQEVADAYENPSYVIGDRQYRRFAHGVDIIQTVAVLTFSMGASVYMDTQSRIAIFIAALCHDINHPGASNAYLIEHSHPLATEYSFPVLQNMHIGITHHLLKKHRLLNHLDQEIVPQVLQTIAHAIASADMDCHTTLLQEIRETWLGPHGTLMEFGEGCTRGEQNLLINFVVHSAILSNNAKDWYLATHWAELIKEEFQSMPAIELRQRKKSLMPNPFGKDKSAPRGFAHIQVELIEECIIPMFGTLNAILPKTRPIMGLVKQNMQSWKQSIDGFLNDEQQEWIQELAKPIVKEQKKAPTSMTISTLTRWISTSAWYFLSTLLLLYALFADDLRLLFLPKSYDNTIDYLTLVVLILLVAEIIITSIAEKGYFRSFYFWVDIGCTCTMISDVSFILDAMNPDGHNEHDKSEEDILSFFRNLRAGRTIRLVRMFRLLRLSSFLAPAKASSRRGSVRRSSLRRYSWESLTNPYKCTLTHNDLARVLGTGDNPPPVIKEEHITTIVERSFDKNQVIPPDAVENVIAKIQDVRSSMYQHNLKDQMTADQFVHALQKLSLKKFDTTPQEQSKLKSLQKDKQLTEGANKLGEQISELTITRVIVLVVALLVIIPSLSVLEKTTNKVVYYHLRVLHRHTYKWNTTSLENPALLDEIQAFGRDRRPLHLSLFFLRPNKSAVDNQMTQILGDAYYPNLTLLKEEFRVFEYRKETAGKCYFNTDENCTSVVIMNASSSVQTAATLRILNTLFVALCFVFGSYILTQDTDIVVVGPVERMSSLIQQLYRNPLATLEKTSEKTASYEIKLLEDTLTKITNLLQIGFGEAGGSIISDNIRLGGTLNPMIPGKKVYGVFGFCSIKNFTDITESLKEEVMLFVNTIGWIVHESVHSFHGQANRNLGNAFLVVWKLPRNTEQTPAYAKHSQPPEHLMPTQERDISSFKMVYRRSSSLWTPTIADQALLAFLRTMVMVNSSLALEQYSDHPLLMQNFEYPFTTKMGFGLHFGWAIEGAIGSTYKIDASYLAPDVNMASRLEAVTRQFGVPLMMSHRFYNCLSPQLQEHCRCLDCVMVKGSTEPIALYTCDFVKSELNRFVGLCDVPKLQEGIPPGFFKHFHSAVNAYFKGQWCQALEILRNILEEIKPEDGPSEALLRVIESHGSVAPSDWKGYRQLTAK